MGYENRRNNRGSGGMKLLIWSIILTVVIAGVIAILKVGILRVGAFILAVLLMVVSIKMLRDYWKWLKDER